jgi:hypothetical protein
MRVGLLLSAMVLAASSAAFGGQASLNEWCFYVNTLSLNHSCAEGVSPAMFNPPVEGSTYVASPGNADLGTLSIVVGPGTYNVFAFFSYTVGAAGSYNQYATAVGTLTAGQVYSVDAPGDPSAGGAVSGYTPGFLGNQASLGMPDNTNHLASGDCAATNSCEPVSVALGYTNVVVPNGQQEQITFTASDTPPTSGFYVSQNNPQTGDTVYFSSGSQPSGPGSSGTEPQVFSSTSIQSLQATPEPVSMLLLGSGLGVILWSKRRRRLQ